LRAEAAAEAIRGPCAIENFLHQVHGVTFGDARSRLG